MKYGLTVGKSVTASCENFPDADLWPRTTSVLPVIQEPTIRRLGHPRCVYAERGCSLAALEQN